jgi:hypothetical protein
MSLETDSKKNFMGYLKNRGLYKKFDDGRLGEACAIRPAGILIQR